MGLQGKSRLFSPLLIRFSRFSPSSAKTDGHSQGKGLSQLTLSSFAAVPKGCSQRKELLASWTCRCGIELLGGQHPCRPLGVFVLELGVDLLRQLGLALGLV